MNPYNEHTSMTTNSWFVRVRRGRVTLGLKEVHNREGFLETQNPKFKRIEWCHQFKRKGH